MTKSTAAFSVNDRIHHSVYGLGTICAMNSQHTTIVFDEAGTRKFLACVVRMEHSDIPAPPKAARKSKKARNSL